DLKCVVFTLPERIMREHHGYFKPASGKMADVVTVGSRPLGKSQLIEPRLAGVAAFPQDLRAENGFDNRGDHLSLSPLLMESFLKLGHSITESKDFVPRNIGIWNQFFGPPKEEENPNELMRNRIRWFLRRAFRRSPAEATVDRYVDYAERQIAEGEEFTAVMKKLAAAAISSPKFLYLYDEQDGQAKNSSESQVIDDFDLASRLSFFLWGSIPDDTLLTLAAEGRLVERTILEEQVQRMLQDRKVKRFCDSFPAQWLQLERIISSTPDPERYPGFYFLKYRKSMHMMMEPLLLFETVLIEDLPITQFIDSDFTYRSKLLEQSYAKLTNPDPPKPPDHGPVTVLNFHRVPVNDRRAGGVITNAAVMTMTSGSEETKPITRGAWVAAVIFNDPPEPPPADVPVLPEHASGNEVDMTLRERFALHRTRADCRACHQKIDPFGFALENYDAIGEWRSQYENMRSIDTSGKLFQEHAFDDVIQFKDALLAEKDRFARGFAGHLLSFAVARELGPADQSVLDSITESVATDDYRIQSIIRQIVLSEPFLTMTNSLDEVSEQ
ncbi:MAG: DUF1592 domain-containing protein, partial [Planctomycetaceae bacterium]|nr:DUF1592 domain-containing protein [Planctomycetaceae bacterium]